MIEQRRRADIVVIDFDTLNDQVYEYHYANFLGGTQRLVNRNDQAVNLVMVGGKVAWQDGDFSPSFCQETYGTFLPGKYL